MQNSIPSSVGGDSAPIVEPAKTAPLYPLTDIGNGERFAAMHRDTVRYCPEWKKWLIWDGARWEKDTRQRVFLKAKETIRSIINDLSDGKCFNSDTRTEILKWAVKCESGQRVREMLSAAEKEPNLAVLTSELDQDQWLFNLPNGTLNLRTGLLQPHNPDDLITKVGGCNYDKNAKCPTFLIFLDQVMSNRQEIASYIQRVIGYSLTGTTTEQMINVLHGHGSNGKSRLVEVAAALFGEYGWTIEPETLTVRKNEKMATDIAELFGKRFVDCAETDQGKRFNESMLKRMTGGELLTGERKFENPFTFLPQFQIFFSTNHKPDIRGTDKGIWRRIQLIGFEQTFWDADKGETGPAHLQANKNLKLELAAELPGILNWAIEGCLEWQKNGLQAPAAIQDATASYKIEQDVLGAFIEDCCVVAPPMVATAKELYVKYAKWCDESNEFTMKTRDFNRAIRERGFVSNVGGNNKTLQFKGISVIHTQ